MDMKIALTSIVKSFLEPLSYIYEDEDEGILELLLEHANSIPEIDDHRRRIPKADDYVEHIVPTLSSIQFQYSFRYALLYCLTYQLVYICKSISLVFIILYI